MGVSISALQAVELFSGLTSEELEAVIEVGHDRMYQEKEVILNRGDQSTEIYVLISGQVEVISEISEDATSFVILGAGQSFGEMALLDAGPRSAAIRCVSEEAEILVFGRDELLDFWRVSCEVGYKMLFNIARDLAFKLRIRNLTWEMEE